MKVMIWKDSTDNATKEKIIESVFNEIRKNYKPAKTKPVFIRIAGQSGSGKTSQVLPALVKAMPNTYVLTVGKFMKYFEEKNVTRESSNGFCLNILTAVLYKIIDAKISVILDMTLLTKKYEKLMLQKLKEKNYEMYYMLLSVPKKQSNLFILQRQIETNRVVYKSSAKFFFSNLIPSLKYLKKHNPKSKCVIWSAYELCPIYNCTIENCLPIFINNIKKMHDCVYTKEQLCEAKIKFLSSYNFCS